MRPNLYFAEVDVVSDIALCPLFARSGPLYA